MMRASFSTLYDVHATMPPPMILYSRTRFDARIFSWKFHNPTGSYEGFCIDLPEGGGKPSVGGDSQGVAIAGILFGLDFSITKNVASVFFVCGLMLWLFISVGRRYNSGVYAPRCAGTAGVGDTVCTRHSGVEYRQGEGRRFMPFLLTLFSSS